MTSSDKIIPFKQVKNRQKIDEIMKVLRKIFMDLTNKVDKIQISKNDNYEICFTLFCYEKNNKYKYICLPKNINQEKLAEYLFTFISIYEYKKNQH